MNYDKMTKSELVKVAKSLTEEVNTFKDKYTKLYGFTLSGCVNAVTDDDAWEKVANLIEGIPSLVELEMEIENVYER